MLHSESHYIIRCISTHCVRVGHLCTGTLLLLKRFQNVWYFMVTTCNKITCLCNAILAACDKMSIEDDWYN